MEAATHVNTRPSIQGVGRSAHQELTSPRAYVWRRCRTIARGYGGSQSPIGAPGAMPQNHPRGLFQVTGALSSGRTLYAYALAFLFFTCSAVPAFATCGTGNPPSYDDITGIQFDRGDCSTFEPKELRLTCASYSIFVSNWDHHQQERREYEQFAPPDQQGDYTLNVGAADIIAILRQYKFFELNPTDIAETDVPYTVLAVKHCAVVTRISLPPEHPSGSFMRVGSANFDTATQALFDVLDTFIKKAPKTLISKKPRYTEVNWDGWL